MADQEFIVFKELTPAPGSHDAQARGCKCLPGLHFEGNRQFIGGCPAWLVKVGCPVHDPQPVATVVTQADASELADKLQQAQAAIRALLLAVKEYHLYGECQDECDLCRATRQAREVLHD